MANSKLFEDDEFPANQESIVVKKCLKKKQKAKKCGCIYRYFLKKNYIDEECNFCKNLNGNTRKTY